jgi:hypothetical protein
MNSEYDKGKEAQRSYREKLRANTSAVEFIIDPPGVYEPVDDRRRQGMHRVAWRSTRHPTVETFVRAPMRQHGATWEGATEEDWTQATFIKRLDWEENAPRFMVADQLTLPLGMIDFWYDKAMYGKVDTNQQPIFFSEAYMLGLIDGNLELTAPSFVAQAWRAFNKDWAEFWHTNAEKTDLSVLWDGGLFKPDASSGQIRATSAWISVHPGYQAHMAEIFLNFQSWTVLENRRRKILTFKDFIQAFLYYFDSNAPTTPASLSGYILSRYCPRAISGFQIELADRGAPSDDLVKKQLWQNDPNFEIFIAKLREFGFMLDFNIPWRVVADVTSTPMREFIRDYAIEGKDPGGASKAVPTLQKRARELYREKTPESEALAKKYDAAALKYQTKSLDIMFRTCYYRSDSQDLQKLMNYLCTFWNDYATAFPTEVVTKHQPGTSGTNMQTVTITYRREPIPFDGKANPSGANIRDPYSILGGKMLYRRTGDRNREGKPSSYDVWVDTFGSSFPAKFYFFIRAREGAVNWSQKRFDQYVKIMTDYQKNFDGKAALEYINSKIQRLPSPGGNPAFRTVEHPSKLYSLYESRERSRAGAGVFMLNV